MVGQAASGRGPVPVPHGASPDATHRGSAARRGMVGGRMGRHEPLGWAGRGLAVLREVILGLVAAGKQQRGLSSGEEVQPPELRCAGALGLLVAGKKQQRGLSSEEEIQHPMFRCVEALEMAVRSSRGRPWHPRGLQTSEKKSWGQSGLAGL